MKRNRLHPDDEQRPDRPLTFREKLIGATPIAICAAITIAAVVLFLRWLFGG